MGGGRTETVTQNTVTAPWGPSRTLLQQGLDRAMEMYEGGTLTPAPFGPMLADESANTIDARRMIGDVARGGNPITEAAIQNYTGALNEDPYRNLDRVEAAVLRSTLPSVASYFENSGMMDSSVAGEGMAEAASRAIAPIKYGAYENARNRNLSALSMAPVMTGLPYMDAEMLGRIGSSEDIRMQQELDDIINQYYAEEDNDYENLLRIAELGYGYSGMGGTSSGTATSRTRGSPFSTIGNILRIGGAFAGMF